MDAMIQRAGFWCAWGTVAALLVMGAIDIKAQADIERRVAAIEDVHPDRRLSIVETRLDSIEFLGKAILTGVIGQLVLQGLNFRSRKSQNDASSRRIYPPSSMNG